MRAIIRFQYGRKFRKLMDKWEVGESAKLLLECEEEKKEIVEDMEDVEVDMEMLRRYIKRFQARASELKHYKKEAELRLPQVEGELDDLGIEDIEGGE